MDAVEAALKGDALTAAQGAPAAVTIARSLPHGHVAAAWAMTSKLGLPGLLGPACPQRDLALALVISRVAHPGSKLSTLAWWADTTLGPDLGVEAATTDDVYAAMDWLYARQDAIESRLARRHLAPQANPQRMALFDLSSSWLEGTHCPLGERGYSRDGKKDSHGPLRGSTVADGNGVPSRRRHAAVRRRPGFACARVAPGGLEGAQSCWRAVRRLRLPLDRSWP